MLHKNAARVFPEPVGARMRVCLAAAIDGQPCCWGGLGYANRCLNQRFITGWNPTLSRTSSDISPLFVSICGCSQTCKMLGVSKSFLDVRAQVELLAGIYGGIRGKVIIASQLFDRETISTADAVQRVSCLDLVEFDCRFGLL